MKRLTMLLLVSMSSAASAQTNHPTYGDLVAARRAGTNIVRAIDQHAVTARRLVSRTSSNAVVEIVQMDGTTSTNVVRYALIRGAEQVRSNVAARVAENVEYRRWLVIEAAGAGQDTNAVLAGTPDAMLARAALYRIAATRAQAGNTGTAAAGAAAGVAVTAAAALLLRKKAATT